MWRRGLVGFGRCLLVGGHDLDVLESAVCRVIVRVTAGNAGAVADGDRGSGQLRQTLVLSVDRQLVCRNTKR